MKFDSLDKKKITSSESKNNLGRSGEGLIASLGINAKTRPKKYKKARYAIRNFNKKDLSKIIREFEKLSYESYERNRPKHEPMDSYYYLSIYIENFMVRADSLDLHVYPVRKKKTATK